MGEISTSIRLTDQMSPTLRSMYSWVTKTNTGLTAMRDTLRKADDWPAGVKRTTDAAKDLDRVVTDATDSADRGFRRAARASGELTQELGRSSGAALDLGRTIQNVFTVAAIVRVGRTAYDWIQKCTDAFAEQASQVTQLQTTLRNMMGGAEGQDAYRTISDKAAEIASRGMFSQGAMTAGASELATYFTDPEAITSMMDTLTDYAAGMSGGQAVSAQQMTDYATGLAKVTTGAYDAMTKKGFQFTEAQKAIVKGEATQLQLAEALGSHDGWEKMTDDMRVAAVMSDIIGESWAGMYETMSQTPTGKIEHLRAQMEDLQETLGQKISGSVMHLLDVASNALSQSGVMIDDVGNALNGLINIAASAITVIATGGVWIRDNWAQIRPVLEGLTTAVLAYKAACTAAAAVSAVMANPVGALVTLLGLAAAAVFAYGNAWAETEGYSSSAVGTIVGSLNVVKVALEDIFAVAQGVFAGTVEGAAACVHNMKVDFLQGINFIRATFYDLLATIMEVVNKAIEAISHIPGVEQAAEKFGWDLEWAGDQSSSYARKANQIRNEAPDLKYDIGGQFEYGYNQYAQDAFGEGWAEKAFRAGAAIGDDWVNDTKEKLGLNFEPYEYNPEDFEWESGSTEVEEIAGNTGSTAKSAGQIKKKLDDTEEDLKYLCDIAEREAINRFTTADINVTMTNTNQISSQMDIDDVISGFAVKLEDALMLAAEGV